MDNVYKLHGLPQVLISDRDLVFTSTVWQELFKLSDTKLNDEFIISPADRRPN
jgi:hypothetical protein